MYIMYLWITNISDTGSRPLQSKGTVVPVHKVDSFDSSRWGFNITEIDDKTVSLKLFSTADAIVGRYQIFIDTFHKNPNGDVDKFRYKHPDDIYIIFNPWSQGMFSTYSWYIT